MKTNCLMKKIIKIKREMEINREVAKMMEYKRTFNINR